LNLVKEGSSQVVHQEVSQVETDESVVTVQSKARQIKAVARKTRKTSADA
jgi:hypothetical protein